MWKIVCVHYYDNEKNKNKFLKEKIIPFFNYLSKMYSIEEYYYDRDWKFGPHFEIHINISQQYNFDEIFNLIKKELKSYMNSNHQEIEIDKSHYIEVANQLSKLEEVEEGFLPIKSDGEIWVKPYLKTGNKGKHISNDTKLLFEKFRIVSRSLVEETLYYLSKKCSKDQDLFWCRVFF